MPSIIARIGELKTTITMKLTQLKLLFLGDGAVGKTSFGITLTTNSFPDEYIPTAFDNYLYSTIVDNKPYDVGLWDTSGDKLYDRLRPNSYHETDVFLLFFDVGNRKSLENIENRWLPELNRSLPETPRILVGNKTDLRNASQFKL